MKVTILNETLTLPSYKLVKTPLHPGASFGFNFLLKEKERSSWLLNTQMGFYYHKGMQSGVFLYPEIAYNFNLLPELYIMPAFGVGYLHSFYTQDIYELKEGQYVKKTHAGDPRMIVSLSLGIRYSLTAIFEKSFDVMAKYSAAVEAPYATKWGVPVGPHTFFEAGVILYPFK